MEVKTRWPLHYHVWVGDRAGLERHLNNNNLSPEGIEALDARGNTPLMLAVMLGELEFVRLLLSQGARANVINRNGWSALHEATARGNADLVSHCTILFSREYLIENTYTELSFLVCKFRH